MQADDLIGPEVALWNGYARGVVVDLGGGDPTVEDAKPEDWGPNRQIRAEVIAALLLGAAPAEAGYTAAVRLSGARITGVLNLDGAIVGCRLEIARCWFDHDVSFSDAKTRTLWLDRSRLLSVDASRALVDGWLTLEASHLTRLIVSESRVGGITLEGARLTNPDGEALVADRLTVEQGMLCRDGFTATGVTRLLGARIGGELDFSGATLTNPDGDALVAARLTVKQDMLCSDGFTATGVTRLLGARIGGELNFDGATLTNPHGATSTNPYGSVLDCEALQAQSLILSANFAGTVDLTSTRTSRLVPSPKGTPTVLDGLEYTSLLPEMPVRESLLWLKADPTGYSPQPYEQLAAHFRKLGHDDQARVVLLAKRRAHRRSKRWLRRPVGWLQDLLAGYGYAPGRAFAWLGVSITTGWWYFGQNPPNPTPASQGQAFNALLYATDLVLPTSPLALESGWRPSEAVGTWLAIGLQALGWALSLAVLPAVARALART